jgi:hypothetical protein
MVRTALQRAKVVRCRGEPGRRATSSTASACCPTTGRVFTVRVDAGTGSFLIRSTDAHARPGRRGRAGAARAARAGLRRAGYTVDVAADGEEGLYAALEYPIDLAIVDLGLPKRLRPRADPPAARAGKRYPVLILTARDRWQDKVEGLKPAPTTTSSSRSTSRSCSRACRRCCAAPAAGRSPELVCGPVALDTRTQQVTVAGGRSN